MVSEIVGQRRDAWVARGNTWPTCINEGCSKDCAARDWKNSGIPSIRTECSRCNIARRNGKVLPGITFHKKRDCENQDGHLGFICPINRTLDDWKDPDSYSHLLEMDHKDGKGAAHNNAPENVETLCKLCHGMKGMRKNDFNPVRNL